MGGEDRLQRAELLAQVEDAQEALRLRLVEQRHRAHHCRLEIPEPREEGGGARGVGGEEHGEEPLEEVALEGSRRAGGRHLRGEGEG